MGRPALHLKAIIVRLADGIPERIDALVGKNRRGIFIREAIEAELSRREKVG